jgi:hypothetical protein
MRTFTRNDKPVNDFVVERRFPDAAYNEQVVNIGSDDLFKSFTSVAGPLYSRGFS